MGKLDNKVAVVSGAARGQGRSHAVNLAAEGASIIALDICADLEGNTYPLSRPEDLEETARLVEKEAVRCHTAIVDVRERSAVWKAIADGVDELGRLDIVVANAGICPMGKGQTIQSWSDTIDTDLVGVFNVIQASLPYVNDGGSIIATGSLAAQLGSATNQGPGGSAYSLAKQLVARYVNDLSIQLAKRMIRVNAVHPTNVNTDMLHNEGLYKVFRPDLQSPTRMPKPPSRPCRRCRFLTSSRRTCRTLSSFSPAMTPAISPARSCGWTPADSSRRSLGKGDQLFGVVEDALENVVEVDVVGEADVAVAVTPLCGEPLRLLLQPLQHHRPAGVHSDRRVGVYRLLGRQAGLDERGDRVLDLLQGAARRLRTEPAANEDEVADDRVASKRFPHRLCVITQ